uniref:Uncharacterized protein n=1 Tax=Corethron hystrix TaxID=216773 RepID=A0A7S1B3Y7_9STRA|mmetsp:Transcript_1099/g.2153  ORF Transcript_1099/g.2153 Transcript_1099/m.2153 type:complete len:344 (+) Transcript_1099:96-1127(+)
MVSSLPTSTLYIFSPSTDDIDTGNESSSNRPSAAIALRDALIRHFIPSQSATTAISTTDEGERTYPQIPTLSISNRYFSAHVRVIAAALRKDGTAANPPPLDAEAIILAFYDDAESGLSPLLLSELTGADDGLRLAAALVPEGPSKSYTERVLTCLDAGVEYVDAVGVGLEKGEKEGHNEREKEGFARICEAVECQVWRSAVMVCRQKFVGGGGGKASALATEAGEGGHAKQKNMEVTAAVPEDDPEQIGTNILTEGQKKHEENLEELLAPLSPDNNGDNEDEEQHFQKMDQLLAEARSVREMSIQGDVDDGERRRRAADTAMRMWNILGDIEEKLEKESKED